MVHGIGEGCLIALHRAVEIVEGGILAKAGGVDIRGLRLGGGLDDLGVALALRADGGGLLLARGLHPAIGGIERRAIGQIGGLDPHVDDLHAILPRFAIKRGADFAHHLAAFRREQRLEGVAAQLLPQHRGKDRLELLDHLGGGAAGADHLHRIDDAEAGEGVDLQPEAIRGEHLLAVHLHREHASVDPDDILDERNAEGEAGAGVAEIRAGGEAVDHPDGVAEAHDHALFGFRNDDDAGGKGCGDNGQRDDGGRALGPDLLQHAIALPR